MIDVGNDAKIAYMFHFQTTAGRAVPARRQCAGLLGTADLSIGINGTQAAECDRAANGEAGSLEAKCRLTRLIVAYYS
jgi:hypothetical protein